jgi:hypothetical protein
MSDSDQAHGFIPGKLPAVVASYDKKRRECRVHIPGLTDGTGPGISAEIEYPIGDKSKAGEFSTDILILAGDTVWVEFECGDARYPIITGFRNPRVGNGTDWRRFHQDNIELLAVKLMQFIAGGNVLIESTGANITIKSPSLVTIEAPLTHIKGALTVDDLITGTGGISVSGGGGAAISGGTLTHNGVNVGSDHTHTEQGDGADVSPPH